MATEPGFRCGGVIGPDDTVETLLERGFTENDAREVLLFREYLSEGPDEDFETWRAERTEEPTDE